MPTRTQCLHECKYSLMQSGTQVAKLWRRLVCRQRDMQCQLCKHMAALHCVSCAAGKCGQRNQHQLCTASSHVLIGRVPTTGCEDTPLPSAARLNNKCLEQQLSSLTIAASACEGSGMALTIAASACESTGMALDRHFSYST